MTQQRLGEWRSLGNTFSEPEVKGFPILWLLKPIFSRLCNGVEYSNIFKPHNALEVIIS
jgi:hypothetical protein